MREPEVSVLIPAYRAGASLPACIESLLAGKNAAVPAEIVVESDDGTGYAAVAGLSDRVRIGRSGAVRSGAGATRNRALARARAPFVTYVDADDTVAPDYLPALLGAARDGAAVARTVVVEAGRTIARYGGPGPLDLAEIGRHGASFRGLFRRDLFPEFVEYISQDILHMVEVVMRTGPVPVAETDYMLRLRQGSLTTAQGFSVRADAAYLRHVHWLGVQYPGHPRRDEAQAVFRAKRRLNRRYVEEAQPGESYYGFIARMSAREDL